MGGGKHLRYDPTKLSMCDDECQDRGFGITSFLMYRTAQKKIDNENASGDILSLYKQMKLQQ